MSSCANRALSARLGEVCAALSVALRQPLAAEDVIRDVGPIALDLLAQDPGAAAELAHCMLHTFPYSDVPPCWRRYYEEAQLWLITCLTSDATRPLQLSDGEHTEALLSFIAGRLDLILILTGAPVRRSLIMSVFGDLKEFCSTLASEKRGQPNALSREALELGPSVAVPFVASKHFPRSETKGPTRTREVTCLECPSMFDFAQHWRNSDTPALLTDTITHWDALAKWSCPNYWLDVTLQGRRLVPVELGSSYTDTEWGQQIMTYRQFLQTHLITDGSLQTNVQPKGYLAQHDLLAQIPILRSDITIPDYCWEREPEARADVPRLSCRSPRETCIRPSQSVSRNPNPEPCSMYNVGGSNCDSPEAQRADEKDATSEQASKELSPGDSTSDMDVTDPFINLWLGPAGTISPAHTDPHHNILAQVVGRKYVRMFPPNQTPRLYPIGGGKGDVKPSSVGDAEGITSEKGGVCPIDATAKKRKASELEIDQAAVLSGSNASLGNDCRSVPEAAAKPPQDEINMSNTSSVDVGLSLDWPEEAAEDAQARRRRRREQKERFPLYEGAEYVEVIMHPGDCLFIPRGWWHYITSLDISCSVSFWWD